MESVLMEINRQHEMQIVDQERQLLLQRFAQDYDLPLGAVMTYIDHRWVTSNATRRTTCPMGDAGGGGGLPPAPPPAGAVQ
jgi:hypothetical protein